MRKKRRIKYIILLLTSLFIFMYGFIAININKSEVARKKSEFTVDLKAKPFDFRVETKEYVFYINGKIITNIKEKCIETYNEVFSK
jgi:hypothetical protein